MAITHPWPTQSGDPRRQSIADLRTLIEGRAVAKKSSMAALDVDDLRVDSLAKACSARLEKYASAAPDAIKDEALTRHVGYFLEANYGAQQSVDLGGVKEMQNTNHGAAFRRSGAMGLLSPWRSRGVGLVGDV